MGIAGEDGGEIFQGGVVVQFLHKNKLKSKICKKEKSLLTKMFSSANINWNWFTEISDF